MSYDTQPIIRDINTNPIPQYFNQNVNGYEPIKGANGAMYILDSRIVLWTHNGNTSSTETVPASTYFSIKNDGLSDLSFTVGSLIITVRPQEAFGENFASFTTVTITTTSEYRAYSKG